MLKSLICSLAFAVCAAAASPNIVISQVYGGGGNSGATYTNDFIEVFNRGGSSVDVTGWSVQYASSSGSTWSVTSLNGTIAPGQYHLVQEAAGSGGTTPLPGPDDTGSINMSASSGKVALVNTSTPLSGTNPTDPSIVDLIGYGSANDFETAPAPGLSNTTADMRASGGCVDTDNNSTDFTAGPPNPRYSGSPLNVCTPGGATITSVVPPSAPAGQTTPITINGTNFLAPVTVQLGGSPIDSMLQGPTVITATVPPSFAAGTYTLTVLNGDGSAPSIPFAIFTLVSIDQIQGSGDTSPYVGQMVETEGVVTALKYNGFFIQTPDGQGDNDPNTSEGIFVYTSSAPPATAVAGNLVQVAGTVSEYIPSSDPYSPSFTELTSPAVTVISTGNPLPAPINLTTTDLNPSVPYDNLEKYEGMRVHVDSLTVTSPTQGTVDEVNATAASNGLFFGVLTGTPRPFREPGVELPDPLPPGSPPNVPRFDDNPEHIRVDTWGSSASTPVDVTSGAVVTNLTGPLDYGYRNYSLVQDPGVPLGVTGNVSATPAPTPTSDEFTVSSFNLERFYDDVDDPNTQDVVLTPQAYANRLVKASLAIRNVLLTPDILGVEEMENLSTLQALAAQIDSDAEAAGQIPPHYQCYLEEGNDISGINVGFLINTSKITVSSVVQMGKDTTYIDPITGLPAILNDRPPLVLQGFVGRPGSDIQQPLTVIVNHLRSLSGIDDPNDGVRVRAKREAQCEYLAGLLQSYQSSAPGTYLASIGDYNAYQFNDGYVDVMGCVYGNPVPADQVVVASPDLVDPNLTDLITTMDPSQQYSYTYDGDAEAIDHIVVDGPLLVKETRMVYPRNNADFPETYRNNITRPERNSDHDPDVAYFGLPPVEVTNSVRVLKSQLHYIQAYHIWAGTVAIQNIGAATLTGPLQLLFSNLTPGVKIFNAKGTISGMPYITVPNSASVPRGGIVKTGVLFSSGTVSYTARVLAGNF
jgi:uncharacterized protein